MAAKAAEKMVAVGEGEGAETLSTCPEVCVEHGNGVLPHCRRKDAMEIAELSKLEDSHVLECNVVVFVVKQCPA